MTEVVLEFTDPAGDPLRIEWDDATLGSLVWPQAADELPWAISGELDWDELEGVRIFSGRLGADTLLAIGALRPRGAGGHGDELVAGAIGGIAGFDQLEEVLLSTEYGPDGAIRRIGLELNREADGLAIRIAGDLIGTTPKAHGPVRRDSAAFELRSGGDEGIGILDVLTLEA